MSETLPPPPWHAFFLDLDEALSGAARLDCIGGFVASSLQQYRSICGCLNNVIAMSFDGNLAGQIGKISQCNFGWKCWQKSKRRSLPEPTLSAGSSQPTPNTSN